MTSLLTRVDMLVESSAASLQYDHIGLYTKGHVTKMDIETVLREKRDIKARPHLEQYAPVWLVEEKVLPKDDAVIFNVVFEHPFNGWVNRRYRYDAFNDVLYYRGQLALSEAEAVQIQEKTPYIEVTVADVVNSYGG